MMLDWNNCSISLIPSKVVSWNSALRNNQPLPIIYSFSQLFKALNSWTHDFSFYSMGNNLFPGMLLKIHLLEVEKKKTTKTKLPNSSYKGKLMWAGKVPFRAKVLCFGCFCTLECVWGAICYHCFLCLSYIHEPRDHDCIWGMVFLHWSLITCPQAKSRGPASPLPCSALNPDSHCHQMCLHISIPYVPQEATNTKISFSFRFLIHQNNSINYSLHRSPFMRPRLFFAFS